MRERILLLACSSSAAVMPSASTCAVDVEDALQIVGRLLGLATHVGHHHAGPLVLAVAEADVLDQARIDQFPVEPAARVVAQHGGQQFGGVAVVVFGGGAGGELQHVLLRGRFLVQHVKAVARRRPARPFGWSPPASNRRSTARRTATSASKSIRPAAASTMLPGL